MRTWREENNLLVCETARRGPALFYFISAFGVIVILVASLVLLANVDRDPSPSENFFIFLLGLVLLLAGFSGRRQNFYNRVAIDRDRGLVEFGSGPDRVEYRFALADVTRVLVVRMRRSASGPGRSVETHQIFLELRDGAFFWLDTFFAQSQCALVLAQLAAYTGLPVRDETGAGPDLDRQRTYPSAVVVDAPAADAPFVEETVQAGGVLLRLGEQRSLLSRVLLVLVFAMFLSVPLILLADLFASIEQGGQPLLFALFAVPFIVVFLTVLGLLALISSRRYELFAGAGELVVRLRFRPGFLNRFLEKTLRVPRAAIQAVRVNRLEDGFWLSLAVDPALRLTRGGGFLMKIGAFNKPRAMLPGRTENVLSLWEIAASAQDGPAIGDLLRVEARLRSLLKIENV